MTEPIKAAVVMGLISIGFVAVLFSAIYVDSYQRAKYHAKHLKTTA